jgi:ABC-type branched-subunit amino acid transport system substrate-binding protein
MKTLTATARGAAVLCAAALTVSACSTKKADPSGTGGPGVTASGVTVGELTDLSGPYAPLDKSVENAQKLYFDQVNAAGGVCGHQVSVVVHDSGLDVQKATSAFTDLQPQVIGLSAIIGSPIIAALGPELSKDDLLTYPLAWPAAELGKPYLQILGPTYDLQMINGLDFLARTAKLAPGDKVGAVYYAGDYGENALAGAQYEAKHLGLTVVGQTVEPTTTDVTAQVTALKQAGVKAIVFAAGPPKLAALVGTGAAMGLDVPVASAAPGYAPQLLATPAAPALEQAVYVVSPLAPESSTDPAMAKLVADYQAKYPGQPLDLGVVAGWAAANAMGTDLKAACAAGNLSRAGLVAAHRKQSSMASGLGPALDFTNNSLPSSYQSLILKVDASAKGGLTIVEPAHEVPEERSYQLPK